MSCNRLILFPFAGGNSNSFKDLQAEISQASGVECLCIEYSGHGRRLKEKLINDPEELVNDLLKSYDEWFLGNFYFLGYSMGAIIARLLIDKLIKASKATPQALFVLACRSPRLVSEKVEKIGGLPEKEFMQHIINFGGIHQSILNNPDFLTFLSPIIRSDYQAYEGVRCIGLSPVNLPIYVFGGTDDTIALEELQVWEEDTTEDLTVSLFSGGHFFLYDHTLELTFAIIDKLFIESLT